MKAVDTFSLEPIASPGAGGAPRSRLRFRAKDVGRRLEGTHLDGQFLVREGVYLLLVTDDCPREEELHIFLLDESFEVVDMIAVGIPYSPGVLVEVCVDAEEGLAFSFNGKERYQLVVNETPRRLGRLPGVSRSGGVGGKHYLELSRVPM